MTLFKYQFIAYFLETKYNLTIHLIIPLSNQQIDISHKWNQINSLFFVSIHAPVIPTMRFDLSYL
jgi:hypothetical protein